MLPVRFRTGFRLFVSYAMMFRLPELRANFSCCCESFLCCDRLIHLHSYSIWKFVRNERNSFSLPRFQFHSCVGATISTSSSGLIYFLAARGGSKARPICSDIKRCLDVRDTRARKNKTELKRRCEQDWHVVWRVFRDLLLPAALLEWRRLIWRAGAPLGLRTHRLVTQTTPQSNNRQLSLFCHAAFPQLSVSPHYLSPEVAEQISS